MESRDYSDLIKKLSEDYTRHSPKSAALNQQAKQYMVDGGNHGLRLMEPFPPRIVAAGGAYLNDEDGHRILDFWQGHWANILGHNPKAITSKLADALANGLGLQTGFTDRLQIETAEILCRQTGADKVRFTTSGTLATMYATMLARGYTRRDLVMKVGGGWHGAQPWALKGVYFSPNKDFQATEGAGLSTPVMEQVLVTRYNDPDLLSDQFRQYGDRIACFIIEPYMGSGGGMPATSEYLKTARELTHRYGSVLIYDEVISGFRFRAGDLGSLIGIRPDLAVFGKVMSGGAPVTAVAGSNDIMRLLGHREANQVKFYGGTFSGHPLCMLAAKKMMSYLVEHEATIYPRLIDLAEKGRQIIETSFAEQGIYAQCAGYRNDAMPASSLIRVHFPYRDGFKVTRPDEALDPSICDVALSEKVLRIAMLLEDVNVMFGLGAFSTAHTEADLETLKGAFGRVARRIKEHCRVTS